MNIRSRVNAGILLLAFIVNYWDGIVNVKEKVEDYNENIPLKYSLNQNYPNPFNPSTTIKYSIPVGVKGERIAPTLAGAIVKNVTLTVYDILGREVAILVNEKQKPGNYEVEFDAGEYPSGVYFYRLNASNYSNVKKMILLK